MALDQNYFDSIHIDVVKKKYYNANKVNAVFNDIKAQAVSMAADNEAMRAELAAKNGKAYEVGDAIISAGTLARKLTEDAKAEAAAIVEAAEKRCTALEAEAAERCAILEKESAERCAALEKETAERCTALEKETEKRCADLEAEAAERCVKLPAVSTENRDLLVAKLEATFSRMREQHLSCIETINEDWRSLLCDIYADEETSEAPVPVASVEEAPEESVFAEPEPVEPSPVEEECAAEAPVEEETAPVAEDAAEGAPADEAFPAQPVFSEDAAPEIGLDVDYSIIEDLFGKAAPVEEEPSAEIPAAEVPAAVDPSEPEPAAEELPAEEDESPAYSEPENEIMSEIDAKIFAILQGINDINSDF